MLLTIVFLALMVTVSGSPLNTSLDSDFAYFMDTLEKHLMSGKRGGFVDLQNILEEYPNSTISRAKRISDLPTAVGLNVFKDMAEEDDQIERWKKLQEYFKTRLNWILKASADGLYDGVPREYFIAQSPYPNYDKRLQADGENFNSIQSLVTDLIRDVKDPNWKCGLTRAQIKQANLLIELREFLERTFSRESAEYIRYHNPLTAFSSHAVYTANEMITAVEKAKYPFMPKRLDMKNPLSKREPFRDVRHIDYVYYYYGRVPQPTKKVYDKFIDHDAYVKFVQQTRANGVLVNKAYILMTNAFDKFLGRDREELSQVNLFSNNRLFVQGPVRLWNKKLIMEQAVKIPTIKSWFPKGSRTYGSCVEFYSLFCLRESDEICRCSAAGFYQLCDRCQYGEFVYCNTKNVVTYRCLGINKYGKPKVFNPIDQTCVDEHLSCMPKTRQPRMPTIYCLD